MQSFVRQSFLVAFILIGTACLYWAGLSGPFLFDDEANLAPLQRWLADETPLREVVFGNHSGPAGRSISMASFAATTALWGYNPWSFKLGSLIVHLGTGVLAFLLYRAIAARDPALRSLRWAPLVLMAVWLWHPMQVSTVLYSVQRMAMLSSFFMLAALLVYWHGRLALEADLNRLGLLLLFGLFPLLTVAAILSKENGILAPLLCSVLEWVYFRPARGRRRPAGARWFLVLGTAMPIALALIGFALRPARILGGYENREFSLTERLLTESRVLFDYVGNLLLPWGPSLSLYRDDYVVSTGLLSPATTLFSIAGWLAVVVLAIRLRRAIPAFSAGVGLFLVGHLLESTVIPLLLYFEHRNYLPAFGLFLATAGLLTHFTRLAAPRMNAPKRVFGIATALLCLTLAVATHARVRVWQDHPTLLASSLASHPDSRWLRMEIGQWAMNQSPPQIDLAREQYRHLTLSAKQNNRTIGWLGLAAVECFTHGRLDAATAEQMLTETQQVMEPDLLKALENLSQIILTRPCKNLSAGSLADNLARWLDRSPRSERSLVKWRTRFLAARLYVAEDGLDSPRALEQARVAWASGAAEAPVGAMIVGIELNRGNIGAANLALESLEPLIAAHDVQGQKLMALYRRSLKEQTLEAKGQD